VLNLTSRTQKREESVMNFYLLIVTCCEMWHCLDPSAW